jgi:hypothetical protein
VRLSPLGTSATNWPFIPAPDDDEECGAVGGMRIGRGNQSNRRKSALVPLCPPQIPQRRHISVLQTVTMNVMMVRRLNSLVSTSILAERFHCSCKYTVRC